MPRSPVSSRHAYKQKIADLTTLLHSVELINSTIDFHAVLNHLMELARKITGAAASSALLLSNDKLIFASVTGTKRSSVKKVYLEKNEGIAGWVVSHGKPVMVSDVRKDTRFSTKVDTNSHFKTRSILADRRH